MDEIFKDIPGYEGKYQVSNMGQVKSLNYHREHKTMILKPRMNACGYLQIGLYKNNRKKTIKIHRLVLLSFIGKSNLQCNHRNGNKIDNRLENLEYCTCSENIKHAYKLGLIDRRGERQAQHKLTEKDVLEIRKLYKTGNYSQRELGENYNITQTAISCIITRKNWTHI